MRATFIDRTIKSLTRQFGRTVVYKNETVRSRNTQTGAFSREFEVASAKSLIMPANSQRDVIYDLSFIAANKNFTYGGAFDKELKEVTVRKALLPQGFEITLRTLIYINNRAHMIRSVEEDMSAGEFFYRIIAKRTEQVDLGQTIIQSLIAATIVRTINPTVVIA